MILCPTPCLNINLNSVNFNPEYSWSAHKIRSGFVNNFGKELNDFFLYE